MENWKGRHLRENIKCRSYQQHRDLQLDRSITYLITILHSYLSYANILFTCFLTFGEIAFPKPIYKLHQSKTPSGIAAAVALVAMEPAVYLYYVIPFQQKNDTDDILVSVVLTKMMSFSELM